MPVNKVRFCVLLAWTASSSLWGQTTWPDAGSVAEAMTRANNYWMTQNSVGNSDWARAAYYTGNQRAARVLSARTYADWAFAWGNANQWLIGPAGSGTADSYCCGQTYLDLYRLDAHSLYLTSITNNLNAWVASAATNQLYWIDAFYMAGPTFASLGRLTGDTNYYQKLWQMFSYMKGGLRLFDTNASLWFRDATFVYPLATNAAGGKVFWSRGNGWVFAGLARVLQQMSTDSPHYQDFAMMFTNMAPAIKAVQGSDGMWRSSLYDPSQYPNPETSGTGFFAYGLAWGIRSGLLPAAAYQNTVTLAWQGLTNLALNAQGHVGYVQAAGVGPAAAAPTDTADYGVGAFLLACSEIDLLATNGPALGPWAGPDQTLITTNASLTARLNLDGSPTEVYRPPIGAYSWWEGTNQIASGVTNSVILPLGQHAITLQVLGSDGFRYSDTATITVTTQSVVTLPSLAPSPALQFKFEDAGLSTTDAVAGTSLNLVNGAGAPTDLHGLDGSGVAGLGRSLELSSAVAQGGTGPMAFAANCSTVNFGTISNFTITLWVQPASTLLAGVYPRFFTLGANGITDRGVANSLQLLSDGNFQSITAVQGYINTYQTSTTGFGAFDLPSGQWRFLALTYDGTFLNFYGGSETNPVSLLSSEAFPAGVINLSNSWTLFLGNRNARDRAFQGRMDDVRFYVGAVSTADVELVRQAALSPPAPQIKVRVQGSLLLLSSSTIGGAHYILQTAPSLGSPSIWTSMCTNLGALGFITNTVPLNQGEPSRFFRYVAE